MSKTTTLASGNVTPTDTLLVQLREPDEFPASILITWPASAVGGRSAPVRCNCERGRAADGYRHYEVGGDPSIRIGTRGVATDHQIKILHPSVRRQPSSCDDWGRWLLPYLPITLSSGRSAPVAPASPASNA